MGAGIVTNPYPDFAAMRDEHISPADVRQLMGLDADAELGFDPADVPPLYTVSSYDAVQEVLRDGVRFSSSGYAEVDGRRDGPHHPRDGRARAPRVPLADPAGVQPQGDGGVGGRARRPDRRRVHRRVRRIAARPSSSSELHFPFPVNVIAGLLGLPRADLPKFHRWTVEIISVGDRHGQGAATRRRACTTTSSASSTSGASRRATT